MRPPWGSRIRDSLIRSGLRHGYWLARLYWRVRRSEASGAAVVIWHDSRLLVVSQSYRDGLDLPGGGCNRDEFPIAAASREAREEIGLIIDPAELRSLGKSLFRVDGRTIRLEYFGFSVTEKPKLEIDNREIVWAGWLDLKELQRRPLSMGLERYLEEFAMPGSS